MNEVTVFNPQTSPWLQVHKTLGVDLMEHLYSRMQSKYPRIWRQSFASKGEIEAWKQTWAETFEREQITPAELRFGLANVTKQYPDYPPTEGQFLLCCRPSVDYEAAFLEAQTQQRLREKGKDKWSHPAIYWAAAFIGTFDMRHGSYAVIKNRWTAVLKAELENKPYKEIPPPMLALPDPGRAIVPPEQVAKLVAEAKERMTRLTAQATPKAARRSYARPE